MKKIFFVLASIILTSCSPKISTSISQGYKSLNENEKFIVYQSGQVLPENSKIIGKTKIGDSGFTTNCGFEVMLNLAIKEARKNGANSLQITSHILPSVYGSSCHRIRANLLRIENIEKEIQNINKSDSIKEIEKSTTITSKKAINNFDIPTDKKFLISANYGFGYRTADLASGLSAFQKEYLNQLSSGKTILVKAGYQPKNNKGFYGIQYSNFTSSANLNNVTYTEPNGFEGSGSISDQVSIYFIGVGGGILDKGFLKHDSFMLDMYLGYINYSDVSIFTNSYTASGSNLGISADLSYYFGLNKNFKIGPTISFNGGVLKEFDVKGNNGYSSTIKLPKETVESLYRFDLLLGTSIQF